MTLEASRRDVSLEALRTELGAALTTDEAILNAARADRSGHVSPEPPLAVIEATTVEHVQATMRFASAHRIPVVPRGAGTGLAGAANGGAGELVLSTAGMNRVLEISVDDELAVVEPGVLNGDLNTMLASRGLWFAPDPASRAISTIGGNIATNAGGLLCAKYGVTREAVLGLKAVLPDGRLISTGHRTVKGVTGYDLTALLVGSEGTLAVIVEATLRLRPLPGTVATLSASFPTVDDAARAASVIVSSGLKPAIMELLDATALQSLGEYLGLDLGGRGAQLMVQTDGAASEAEAADAAGVIRSSAGQVELTTDPEEGERLFAIRRAFHPSLVATGRTVLIEDVAVPRSALPAMFAAIQRIEKTYGISIPTVAHAGDGNLHPNFVFDAPTAPDGHVEVPDHVWAAADEMFLDCLRLGGTLTGEHGVGLLKRRWLRDELGDDSYELQRGLKRLFDPLGIVNPGKVWE